MLLDSVKNSTELLSFDSANSTHDKSWLNYSHCKLLISRYLLCDVCDGAYHAYCLRPQMASVPKNGWKCKRCRRCTDCNSKTPGSGQSSRWHNNYSVCDSCYQQRNKVSIDFFAP